MKKLRILLVAFSNIAGEYEPLGIECLAGHLNKTLGNQIEVCLMRVKNKSQLQKFLQVVDFSSYDVVGVSLFFNTLGYLERLMKCMSGIDNKPEIVLGNILAAFNIENILFKYPEIIICYSSGELSMQQFVEYKLGLKSIGEVSGMAYLKKGIVQINKFFPGPMAAPMRVFLDEIRKRSTGKIYVQSMSGCPYDCAFCVQGKFFCFCRIIKTKEVLIKELIDLCTQTQHQIRLIDFVDEDLLADSEVAGMVALAILELKRFGILKSDAQIMCSISVRSLIDNLETFNCLVEAGLKRCFIGVESFSSAQLLRYEKTHTIDETVFALETLTRKGIDFEIGLFMFEPETTLIDLKLNCQRIREVKAIASISNPLHQWRALKDSRMYKRQLRENLVITGSYDPSWLTQDWHYVNQEVANIIYAAKKLESGLVQVESAIKEISRSEKLFLLSFKARQLLKIIKQELNELFVSFVERAVSEIPEDEELVLLNEEFEKRAILFLSRLSLLKVRGLTSLVRVSKKALQLKSSGKIELLLPQDKPKAYKRES